jgi:hypothetical protein
MHNQDDSSLEQRMRRLQVTLIDTDTIVQNLVKRPELNGLGGRVVRYVADKDRYVIRMHYTGLTLLLRPECLELNTAVMKTNYNHDNVQVVHGVILNKNLTKKGFMIREEEILHAACGMIRRDPALRKELSERVYQGIEEKGPGALITNVCCVDSVAPRFVETLEELLSPRQSVWMSN